MVDAMQKLIWCAVLENLINLLRHEIESQKSFMHKMQRDFYANIYKRSQQNEDIIGFNTRLSKVGFQTLFS